MPIFFTTAGTAKFFVLFASRCVRRARRGQIF
jgi:hypothetical protein